MGKLVIKDLHVSIENKEILKGVNLEINDHEMVALLGPNGHGKSTLMAAIMGNPRYKVTSGSITYNGEDVLKMSIDERSRKGLFLAFQNPCEIPGVITADFYKNAINSHNEKKVSLYKFYKSLENACKEVHMPFDMMNRMLNEGFSGGEKKRNEILQMMLLNPSFAMLDEIDSGLDVDAINIVSECIKKQFETQNISFLVISHYARLFDLIHPTKCFVMINGRIATSGDASLIEKIDTMGYEWIKTELGIEIEKEDTNASMNKVSLGACATKEAINYENK
ncbi:MAG: Fe-S cluster assembly ATPase SufC [Mollicutes bacterium]|nr:Fe-S cluster assembly ATPase SufC [Mollicutes bacterium]MDD7263547.1 Fe-S cluster assembly ATPase SufC [bacterium]MDY4979938.1 Fe-S cluster assembly ATPase SufC [Candidatus Onthovivens sp.]